MLSELKRAEDGRMADMAMRQRASIRTALHFIGSIGDLYLCLDIELQVYLYL
jgi:hypothetical protein